MFVGVSKKVGPKQNGIEMLDRNRKSLQTKPDSQAVAVTVTADILLPRLQMKTKHFSFGFECNRLENV